LGWLFFFFPGRWSPDDCDLPTDLLFRTNPFVFSLSCSAFDQNLFFLRQTNPLEAAPLDTLFLFCVTYSKPFSNSVHPAASRHPPPSLGVAFCILHRPCGSHLRFFFLVGCSDIDGEWGFSFLPVLETESTLRVTPLLIFFLKFFFLPRRT